MFNIAYSSVAVKIKCHGHSSAFDSNSIDVGIFLDGNLIGIEGGYYQDGDRAGLGLTHSTSWVNVLTLAVTANLNVGDHLVEAKIKKGNIQNDKEVKFAGGILLIEIIYN